MRNSAMNKQAIGIFDSGVGGLAVAQAVHQLLPSEDLLYIADSGFMPYGSKTQDEIRGRCHAIVDYMAAQGAKAVVVACNTATMAAIGSLRAQYSLPIIGVEPGVKPALQQSKSGIIGVLATPSTIASQSFQRLCRQQAEDLGRIVFQPCPELAATIEALHLDGEHTEALLRRYCEPLLSQGVDVLVLGCTHYAFIAPLLRRILPQGVSLITTEQAVALQLQRRLAPSCPTGKEQGRVRLLTSGDSQRFSAQLQVLWPSVSTLSLSAVGEALALQTDRLPAC